MSNRIIYKYAMDEVTLDVELSRPTVLLVAFQPDAQRQPLPTVWIEQDDPQRRGPDTYLCHKYRLEIIGTGDSIATDLDPLGDHVGSCICGPYVWHVYMRMI